MIPKILFESIKSELGEGPMWHPTEAVLYWVDILQKKLHRFDPKLLEHQVFSFEKMPGAVVPTESANLLMLSFEDGVASFDTKTEELKYVIYYHKDQPNMRANDGKCDAFGNFWVGTMSKTCENKAGALYCLKPILAFDEMVSNVTISNGLCWTGDNKTMYFIDTFAYQVKAFDMNENAFLSNERMVIDGRQESLGYFDGMTIDTEGMLWIAHCTDSCIRRWNPNTGQALLKIDLPVPKVTSLTFGGENYHTLYITTAQEHMSAQEIKQFPLSGSIFYLETDYQGFETNCFSIK